MSVDRRTFIKYASLAAAGNAAALRPFGALNALAQTTTDYKALVCVFLFGGNDANNTLVPFDTAGYANYATIRGPIALPQTGATGTALIQLGNATPNFSLNPNLPEIASLFQTNTHRPWSANVVARWSRRRQRHNISQAQPGFLTNLFSHSDQQLEWQNAAKSGATQTGWAGRIADQLARTYNLSGAGADDHSSRSLETRLFCNGSASTPVSVSPGNLGASQCSEGTTECTAQQQTAQALLSFSTRA